MPMPVSSAAKRAAGWHVPVQWKPDECGLAADLSSFQRGDPACTVLSPGDQRPRRKDKRRAKPGGERGKLVPDQPTIERGPDQRGIIHDDNAADGAISESLGQHQLSHRADGAYGKEQKPLPG